MRILSITAGAADMYCGSCLRDNALAAELMAQGHEVTLLPLYTPTRTDETNVSQEKVFFGGISVYLEQHLALFRRTPQFLDRLWDSTLALKAASRRSISTGPRRLAELTISMLKGEDGHQRKEFGKLLDWLGTQPAPEIVNLPNSLLIGLARPLRKALHRPVVCTLQGEDLFLEGLPEPFRGEALDLIRAQTGEVDAFVAVSDYYAGFMSEYLKIPRNKIHTVPVGINLKGYEAGRRTRSKVFTVGYFARVTSDKGLHVLCDAYRLMRREMGLAPSRLEAAGYLGPEYKEYLAWVEGRMKEWGLAEEFHYHGVLDREEKIRFLRKLDVLSVPGPYPESKGIYVLEAMANGVPVVQPRRGAFPEILQKTAGGILVDPDDSKSLARGILSIWKEPVLGEELGLRGAEGVRRYYSVAGMAARTLEVYSGVLDKTKPPMNADERRWKQKEFT